LFTDINTAIVTPSAPVAGFIAPGVHGDLSRANGIGSGTIEVELLNPEAVPEGASYEVTFNSTGDIPTYRTTGYSVIRALNGEEETVLDDLPTASIARGE